MEFMNLLSEDDDSDKSTHKILKIVFVFMILCVTLFFGYFPLFR